MTDMEKIRMQDAAGKVGLGVAQLRNLSKEAGITPMPDWIDTPAGRRQGSFFSRADLDKILDLRRMKLKARSIAAAKVRWGGPSAKKAEKKTRG